MYIIESFSLLQIRLIIPYFKHSPSQSLWKLILSFKAVEFQTRQTQFFQSSFTD